MSFSSSSVILSCLSLPPQLYCHVFLFLLSYTVMSFCFLSVILSCLSVYTSQLYRHVILYPHRYTLSCLRTVVLSCNSLSSQVYVSRYSICLKLYCHVLCFMSVTLDCPPHGCTRQVIVPVQNELKPEPFIHKEPTVLFHCCLLQSVKVCTVLCTVSPLSASVCEGLHSPLYCFTLVCFSL